MTEAWIDRWLEGRIGWHEEGGNAALKQHWNVSGRRVLVPMCGKTVDMLWLEEQGNEVFGVELSELAVEAFFEENELLFTRHAGELTEYRARDRRVSVFCGDYFAFSGERFDAHFDRGALIAMNAEFRPRYATHTSSLLEPGAFQLVIALEYDQRVAKGPPFSVPGDEILAYWPGLMRVEARDDIENGPPKFREAGLKEMTEVVWQSA
jgi:thiopurine S-methyltransferase